jgi:hypothetical protein
MSNTRGNDDDKSEQISGEIHRFQRRAESLSKISKRYWTARRSILVGGALLTFLSFELAGQPTGWSILVLVSVLFWLVAHYHRKILGSLEINTIWLHIKSTQIARINLDWERLPEHDRQAPTPGHPFEFDLDITGKYSLHRLVDTTLTAGGSKRLKDWLLSTEPDLDTIGTRQKLVRELSVLSVFRQRLLMVSAFMARRTRNRLETERILAWLGLDAHSGSDTRILAALSILSAANVLLFALFAIAHIPPYWAVTWFIYLIVSLLCRETTGRAFEQALALEESLKNLATVFGHLEKYRHVNSPNVAALCAPFLDSSKKPSAYLKRVSHVASVLSFRRGNPYLWGPVQAVIPLDFWYAHFFNRYRAALSTLLPTWLDVWFELDALISLANFAFLNPGYIFPKIRSTGKAEEPVFLARSLGHPLIPKTKRISNDFQFDRLTKIAIITGSNMAGKSTFLRTLGMNLCLAYAGAPVAADEFDASRFRLFTCIRVDDSVTDGLSYFYSEVKRLKALLSSVETQVDLPHFFLIDEIFRGTNNRERRIGSCSYIRELARLAAMGVVATHDLGLVKLADEIPGISNYHFREAVVEGRMVFDFKLHPGPCPTTNALTIMRLEGLPVDFTEDPNLTGAEF